MALNDIEQLKKLIEPSKHILLIFSSKDNGDAVAAALALKNLFEKQHRLADIACSEFVAKKQFSFLPEINSIRSSLTNLQKFIIKVDVSKNPIESLSYDIKDSTLNIYLTPKNGLITKNELRTAQSTFKYDLIITLNTPDLESLGNIFFNNTDLFYRTPVVAIDHGASNERYGQVNIIDLSATSTSEIVYKIVKDAGENYFDEKISTAILTGMTIATGSFKQPNLSPTTLQIASSLMARGADREKIIQNLYHTRSIATLKLWGEALTHLQINPRLGFVSTTLTRDNFIRSGGSPDDLHGIIEELISNSPEAKVFALLYEIDNGEKKIGVLVAAEKNFDAMHLARPLQPEGNRHLAKILIRGKTLAEAETLVLKTISDAMPN
ncbi:MAG: DHH family phosphoesterase [Patescibacteria group bacterium]|jgi:nanoRNase/pAp phosphatase (c-di-AMP/oligoRNAs hydrolase)